MSEQKSFIQALDKSILDLVKNAWRISWRNPGYAWFILRALGQQKKAARRRLEWERRGTRVPPFIITSVTKRCNLNCRGCYAKINHKTAGPEMGTDRLKQVLAEVDAMGVSLCLLAGGEPLVRPDVLDVTRMFPNIIFPLFTNGLLIDESIAIALGRQKHVIPVISLEGYQDETDDRRGAGVYQRLQKSLDFLQKKRIFFGCSITMTRENYDTVTSSPFVKSLMGLGSRLFFFIEYVPVEDGTEHLILTDQQRLGVQSLMSHLRKTHPGLFIAFPGDEEAMGGCLAAGRGFVHISPEGQVEPCPFAPYSDASLNEMSFQEALGSNLLTTIREHSHELHETAGGCALWEKREWVQSLVASGCPENGKPQADIAREGF